MKKISHFILPLPRNFLHNSLNIATIPLCFCLVSCLPVSATESNIETVQMDSFREYDWGTSFDDIKQKEISSDMLEYQDYRINDVGIVDGLTNLCIFNGYVNAYDVTWNTQKSMANQNIILVSETLGILYFPYEESIVDLFWKGLKEFHEIDINKELKKAGDGYVEY